MVGTFCEDVDGFSGVLSFMYPQCELPDYHREEWEWEDEMEGSEWNVQLISPAKVRDVKWADRTSSKWT